MHCKIIMAICSILILTGTINAREISRTMPAGMHKQMTGLEPLPDVDFYPAAACTILACDTVGTTWYEYQSNGSSGDRIVYHDDGTVHISWMKLLAWPYPGSPRLVYCNWRDANGLWTTEMQVSRNSPSGYCQMSDIYSNRAAIAYHSVPDEDPQYVTLAVEWDPPGYGFFDYYDPPDQLYPITPESPGRLYWPYIVADRNGIIHIVATENTDRRLQRMAYTRSADAGTTWTTLQLVDTVMVISSVLDASPVSDKVVLAYCAPRDTTSQWHNDIVYYVADSGINWDWRYGMINVTDYANDSDSLWAYTDCDVLIDYNDNIHLVWNAQWLNETQVYFRTYLFHYDDESETITEITHHPETDWADISGIWNRPICKMSLGASPDGDFFGVTWTQFDTSDVSYLGYGNGDIYASYSQDGGNNWWEPENITNTQSDDCFPGDCQSDHWSSLADVISDPGHGLHLTYIIDKDAGAVIQDPPEGSATLNYVAYMNWEMTGTPENDIRPANISLEQNYPNPFNARTKISFELEKGSQTLLEIYDITGARVADLLDEYLPAGKHSAVWDAAGKASGVYFYKLSTDYFTETRQAILIK